MKLIDTAPYQEIMNQNVNAPQEQKNLQNQEKTSEEQVLQKENNDGLIK